MNRNKFYDYIENHLHKLAHRIETGGKLNFLNLHIHAENFYMHFLNLLYGYALENLNTILQNAEAIDLIDHTNKLLFQISSTATKQKIESALEKSILKEYNSYSFAFVSISKDATPLRKKTYKNPYSISFDPETQIHDLTSILRTISSLEISKLKSIYEFIRNELGSDEKNPRQTEEIIRMLERMEQNIIQNVLGVLDKTRTKRDSKFHMDQFEGLLRQYTNEDDGEKRKFIRDDIFINISNIIQTSNLRAEEFLNEESELKQKQKQSFDYQLKFQRYFHLLKTNSFSKAKKHLMDLDYEFPNKIDIKFGLGLLAQSNMENQEAIEYFDEAINLTKQYHDSDPFPQPISSYLRKAACLRALKGPQTTLDFLLGIDKLLPNNSKILNAISISYEQLNNQSQQIQYLEHAIEVPDPTFKAFNNLSSIYYYQGKYDKAISISNQSIIEEPDNPNAYKNKGAALVMLRRYPEALEAAQIAAELRPTHYKYLEDVGSVLRILKKHQKSLKTFQKALLLNPESQYSKTQIAELRQILKL